MLGSGRGCFRYLVGACHLNASERAILVVEDMSEGRLSPHVQGVDILLLKCCGMAVARICCVRLSAPRIVE